MYPSLSVTQQQQRLPLRLVRHALPRKMFLQGALGSTQQGYYKKQNMNENDIYQENALGQYGFAL